MSNEQAKHHNWTCSKFGNIIQILVFEEPKIKINPCVKGDIDRR